MTIKHRQFQHPYLNGGIDVQFNLEIEGSNVSVATIQVNGVPHPPGIPHDPVLEFDNDQNEWRLYRYYWMESKDHGRVKVQEWVNTPVAAEIIKEIIRLKENYAVE